MTTKSKSDKEDSEQKITKQPKTIKAKSAKNKKGMKKDAGQTKQKRQKKITNYFNANSNSTTYQAIPNPEQEKIAQMKEELIAKNEQLNKIRCQKEVYEHKYSVLYMQTKSYKNKTREILIKLLSQEAEKIREERRKVDYRLGYFEVDHKNVLHFKQGDDLKKLKASQGEKQRRYEKLETQQKKNKNKHELERILFAIQFIKKEIQVLNAEVKAKENEIVVYRERQKLAHYQSKCTYAQLDWALVKDSQKRQRYLPLYLIGAGGYGQVYKCFDLEENQYAAIKINNVKMDTPAQEQLTFKHIYRQVQTHINLKHPNIAQIREIITVDSRKIVFVLEFCEGPDLSYYIKEKKCIEERNAKKIIHQVFAGLYYLSELDQKVIHYDLKPSNIIFHRGVVKILDFGLCKLMSRQDSQMQLTSQGLGTYWYLPPQAFVQKATITDNVDIWSAGVIFFEMLYGRKPFAHGVPQEKILQRKLIGIQTEKKLEFPNTTPNGYQVSKGAQMFIEECLRRNPEQRLSASQAYHHKYFNQ